MYRIYYMGLMHVRGSDQLNWGPLISLRVKKVEAKVTALKISYLVNPPGKGARIPLKLLFSKFSLGIFKKLLIDL